MTHMKRLIPLLLLCFATAAAAITPNVNRGRVAGSFPLFPYICSFCVSLSTVDHPLASMPSPTGRCVLVAGGQSNAAQYYNSIYTPIHPSAQYEFLAVDGTLRSFVEQIFGTASAPLVGSLWGKLGDDLIDNGLCTTVVWLPIAIGGTDISQWNSTGIYGQNLVTAFKRLTALGITPNAFLWMQGEADTLFGTTQAQYFARGSDMINMIRVIGGFSGKIYIATETYFKVGGVASTSVPVQLAQAQLVSSLTNVKAGPSFDDLGDTYRFDIAGTGLGDFTHFNGGIGRNTVSSRWITAIQAGGL